MRIVLPASAFSAPSAHAHAERVNLALPSLVLEFLRVFLRVSAPPRQSHSLPGAVLLAIALSASLAIAQPPQQRDLKVEKLDTVPAPTVKPVDRKSTRLNSSHLGI